MATKQAKKKAAVSKPATTKSDATKPEPKPAPSAPKRNLSQSSIDLLLRVKKQVLKYPEKYNQETYCNTEFCLAGHAVFLAKPEVWKRAVKLVHSENYYRHRDGYDLVESTARELLKLPKFNFLGYDLFGSQNDWPMKFQAAYDRAKTAEGRAKVGARVIDDFIKTDGWTARATGRVR